MFKIDYSKVDMVYAAEGYLDAPISYDIAEESLLFDDEIAMEGVGSAVKSFFSWIAKQIGKLIEMIKKHIIEPLGKFFNRKKTSGGPVDSSGGGDEEDNSPKFQKLISGGKSEAAKQVAGAGQKLLETGKSIKIASKLMPKFQSFVAASGTLAMTVCQNAKYITSMNPNDAAVFGNLVETKLERQLHTVNGLQLDFLTTTKELGSDRDIELQEAAVHKLQSMFNELIPIMTKFQNMLSNTNIASQNTNKYYPLEDRVTYFMRDFLSMLNFQITITSMLISGHLTHDQAVKDSVLEDWAKRFEAKHGFKR